MSGTSGLLVTQSIIGETITFTSKNPTDATIYKGIVTGIITFSLSGTFGFDSVSYNAACQRADPTVPAVSALNYFVISLTNEQGGQINRLFADEWIVAASFSVIQNATVYNINIYDLHSKGLSAILTLLQANGFNAVPVTNPSATALSQGSTTS